MPSFQFPDGSFYPPEANAAARLSVTAPATGSTITMTSGQSMLWINPPATIAALTVKLPPNPTQNQYVTLSFGHIVTALTVQDANGVAVTGGGPAGAIGVEQNYRFIGLVWWRWG